ncbi:TraC family protein [Geobacter sp. DSM 9736]|uniref:TraC family protein n=1 Tax=Geobacter sp. DSM 9736 TaxID=1277350 RepID=UPI000B50DD68|nr:TraC family protein [Geobacter sp. DSM 9736]SNB45427.1 conjugal transfer ATP-binding protein TraC [Geobacter sp. DSM 9736]
MGLFARAAGGPEVGPAVDEVVGLSERDRLGSFFPWIAYDEKESFYFNADDTVGMLWECSPMCFAGETTITTLQALFRLNVPERTVVQFILFADPHVEPILEDFRAMKTRSSTLVREVSDNLARFYEGGKEGLASLNGIPVRNFRSFLAVKFPVSEMEKLNLGEIRGTIHETLQGAGLHPGNVDPAILLDWLRRLLNDEVSLNNFNYDEGKEIRRQVFFSTPVETKFARIDIGRKHFRCITPRVYPKRGSIIQTNKLFGGIMGQLTDGDQIRTPFLFSINILMKNQKRKLHTKCNVILQQKGVGSFAPSLARKQEEHMWAADELERGTLFLKVIPTLWVYGSDERLVNESVSRAKRVWEGQNFVMQEDRGILMPLFLLSLPFGLYDVKGNVETLDRDHVMPVDSIAVTLPVQGDFAGLGRPAMLFTARKGQLFGLDIFHKKGVNNHNALICGTSGGGKSFFLNYLLFNYYAMNAKIRVIDIGGSYKKMTTLCGARYLDFSEESQVCLNPFSNIVDVEHDIPTIAPIVAQMIFSSGNNSPSETEMTLITQAVRWAWNQEGTDACIDTVHAYLSNFDRYSAAGGEIREAATRLAFNMDDFRSSGAFGRFFNGRSTFDISNDDFVVLELEHLLPKKSLFRVVTLQVINAVTMDLYLSDRSDRRLVCFDEAWQFLGESSTLKQVIEEGYRRARKYHGSFTICLQSILDTLRFGAVGNVIRENSAFKFFLESPAFEEARNQGVLDYDEFTMQILKSTKSLRPKYSEIFMDTPLGIGVGRLTVDPFSYYAFTSDGEEIAEIDRMVLAGMSYEDAIGEMVRKYRGI